MKKILLIEDVTNRQTEFMSHTNFTLESYDDILENSIGDKYIKVENSLKDDTFNFNDYEIIISHQSAFGDQSGTIVSKLELYCEETKKSLVLFSGGISNYYNNTKYEHIQLNSKDFYSQNLKLFLDSYRNGNINLLILSYGDKWVLDVLLNILEKINLFLNKNSETDILYDEFRNFTNINRLKNINHTFYEIQVENGWVYQKDIVEIQDSIVKYIKDISNV